MSEGSLPPFKRLDPRGYPSKLRDAADRLLDRLRGSERDSERYRERDGDKRPEAKRNEAPVRETPESGGEVGETARRRASEALREHLKKDATNLERAARLRDQAERLEREGTPSESARNRAERAREEVAGGISRLRRSLLSSGDEESARALDLETPKLDPPIQPSEIR